MVIPDWTECKTPEQVAWIRTEARIGPQYTLEPAGNEMPTEGSLIKLPFSTLALMEGGVRFPLHPLLVECLARWRVFTTQCVVNVYRIVMGVVELNFQLDLNLGFEEIMYCYRLQYSKDRVYLQVRGNRNYLVTELPDSSAGKDHHYVFVGGALVDPSLKYALELPMKFGTKDSGNRKPLPLTREQKRAVHKAWAYEERSAATLLHYKPLYKHNIGHHKTNLTLSDTEDTDTEPLITEPKRRRRRKLVKTASLPEAQQDQPSSSQPEIPSSSYYQDTPPSPSDMVRTKINLAAISKKQQTKKDPSTSHQKEAGESSMPQRPPSPSGAPPPPPPPPPSRPSGSSLESNPLSRKRPGAGEERQTKQARPDVTMAHETRRSVEQTMPHVSKVWNPRLFASPDRPVEETDSVLDKRVAVGLASVFFMPKDLEHLRKKPTPQVADTAVSLLGQGMQCVKVFMEDWEKKNTEVRGLQTQLEQSFKRSNELAADVTSYRASAKSLEAEKKSLLLEKASLEEAVAKKEAEASASAKLYAAAQERLLPLEDRVKQLEEQVKRLELEKKSEYDLGMSEALEQIEEQLPEIKIRCRRSGWFLALEAAHIDPLKCGLGAGPSSDVSSAEDEDVPLIEEGEPSSLNLQEPTTEAEPSAETPADPQSDTFIAEMIEDLSNPPVA